MTGGAIRREPPGTYQVWHEEGEGFRPVANVRADNLLTAVFQATGPPESDWREVEMVAPANRSTDVGDVLVNPNGAAFEIEPTDYGFTFAATDFAPHRQAAEMREDFQMGLEEAARGEFAESLKQFADILSRPVEPSHVPEPEQEHAR